MSKILCVDDSEAVRTHLKRIFESDDFTVIEAVDGVQGIDAVKGNPDIKLIIADVNMPVMDGIRMCELLHKDGLIAEIPVIMISTESNATLKAAGKAVGVIAWISKPFNPDLLVATAKKLIASRAAKATA